MSEVQKKEEEEEEGETLKNVNEMTDVQKKTRQVEWLLLTHSLKSWELTISSSNCAVRNGKNNLI